MLNQPGNQSEGILTLLNPVTELANGVLNSTSTIVNGGLNQVTNTVNSTLNSVSNATGGLSNLSNGGGGLLDPVNNPLNGVLYPATQTVNDALNNLTDLLTPNPSDTGATISLSKMADADTVAPGGTITYRIAINNVSNTKFRNLQLFDQLPEQVNFVAAPGASYDAGTRTVVWNLGDLAAQTGSIKTLLVQVLNRIPPGTVIQNRAVLKAGNLQVSSQPSSVTVGAKQHSAFIDGYPDGTFRPEHLTTRAEMATIVARIKGLKAAKQIRQFYDLDANHWAFPYIQAVVEAGIFSGYPDGNFRPDQPITRAEMTSVVLKMNGITVIHLQDGDSLPGQFADVQPSHWAHDAIQTAILLSYVAGYGDGSFQPDKGIKRVEAVVMMNRASGRGPLVDGDTIVEQHFSDVPRTYWGFGWIEEAAKQEHLGVHSGQGERLIRYAN